MHRLLSRGGHGSKPDTKHIDINLRRLILYHFAKFVWPMLKTDEMYSECTDT